MCVRICYQTMWQNADVTACVIAQNPRPIPSLSLRLSLSLSLSFGWLPGNRLTSNRKPLPPSPFILFAFVCLSLNDSCVWIDRQILQPDFVKQKHVNECVHDREESFNHIKGEWKQVSFFHCLRTDFLRVFTNFHTWYNLVVGHINCNIQYIKCYYYYYY